MIGTTVVILFGTTGAMKLPRDRRLEYFNEATIMICVYHLYVFTDFVDNPVTRYQVGYSLIGTACFNVLVNVSVLVYVTYITMAFKLKKLKYTRRNKRILQNIAKKNKNLKKRSR